MPPIENTTGDTPNTNVDPLPVVRPVSERDFEYVDDPEPDKPSWVRRRKHPPYMRAVLALMAVGFLGVLAAAAWIHPYDDDGQARRMSTHTQLGLQPCTMVVMTGKPCPACGMTTSFALLVHGDVMNSLRANWVGTLFCASLFPLAPWLMLCAYRGRLVGIRNGELFSTILLGSLLLLMTARWLYVVLN